MQRKTKTRKEEEQEEEQVEHHKDECLEDGHWKKDLFHLLLVFTVCFVSLWASLYVLVVRGLKDEHRRELALASSTNDHDHGGGYGMSRFGNGNSSHASFLQKIQQVEHILLEFTQEFPWRIGVAHGLLYLFFQSFLIPGTVFLNLLAGALFGVAIGFPLCVVYNTAGSCVMFALSKVFGFRIMQRFMKHRLHKLCEMMQSHRQDLVLYMIFLRVFPFTPNWFINVASPHLGIPFGQFVMGPLIGLLPYNFLSCKAGLILRELTSHHEIIDRNTMIQLVVVAVAGAVLLPRLRRRFMDEESQSAMHQSPQPVDLPIQDKKHD